ncbi:MAG: DUF6100 family protein [Defluviitaleaceae bacterium]|nr:DUF6100 family protein [Defluviitaleaceae bacterium]
MDRQVLLRKIMSIGDEIRRLEQDIIALQSIDIVAYPENYSSLSQQSAIRGEFITRKLRDLVIVTTNISTAEYMERAANDMGIAITHTDGIVDITIPCLLPHRRKKQTGFIAAPLLAALERFGASRPPNAPFERFNHCVICITHVYDRALFGTGRRRDHDNIETKAIIDVINTFLLTDDNGRLCDIYNTSELSDESITRISIMKKDMFPDWVLRCKNPPKSVS